MNWEMAITRNHALLLAIIAELFAMLRGKLHDVGSGSSPLSVGCADTSPRKRGEVKAAASDLTSPLWGEVSAKPTERGLLPTPTLRSIANSSAMMPKSNAWLRVMAISQFTVCTIPC